MAGTSASEKLDFTQFVKHWLPMIVAVVSVALSIVFWMEHSGDDQYYAKISGAGLESQMADFKEEFLYVRRQNEEIILTLGRIEGRLDEKTESEKRAEKRSEREDH